MPNKLVNINTKLIATIVSLTVVATLVVGALFSVASASGIVAVSSNIADVPGGEDLTLTVRAQNDGDVYELEIDHSLQGTLPEFSLYANEANPYGTSGADFVSAGVTVAYDPSKTEWTIDFGPTVTQVIRDNGGDIKFYLVLRDASGTILWGSMDTVTPENTFTFDLVEGTGDELVADEEVIIPGVPNTSFVL